jgi:hypothetical protein
MNAMTLDLPLPSLPSLALAEGLRLHGYVRAGKLRVVIPESAPTKAAASFVTNWSGKGKLLPDAEVAEDPRLAELTAKHLR